MVKKTNVQKTVESMIKREVKYLKKRGFSSEDTRRLLVIMGARARTLTRQKVRKLM